MRDMKNWDTKFHEGTKVFLGDEPPPAGSTSRVFAASRSPFDLLRDDEWVRLVDHLRMSPREAEIARCALQNQKVADVAAQLGLSPHTIHTYRERLFRKLGVRSASELVVVIFAAHVELTRLGNGVEAIRELTAQASNRETTSRAPAPPTLARPAVVTSDAAGSSSGEFTELV